MSRILVFCGTRAAIERFDMLPDWSIACGPLPPEFRARMAKTFCETEGAKLAVDRSMLHGWRAPADTIVLFDPSWPFPKGSAESMQAQGRVALPAAWPFDKLGDRI